MTSPAPTAPAPDVPATAAPTRRRRRVPVPGVRAERPHWDAGRLVVGVDEVGCGAWAGPVTVGAVVMPSDRRVYKLRDSKVLQPAERERLAVRIREVAVGVGIGHASNEEIDRLGLSEARRLAARRALDALPVRPEVALLDGNWDFLAGYGTDNELLVGGDGRSTSIAAASIVAKVTRDAMLRVWDADHPRYAFASNKGYPSPPHRAALREHGPCALHRHSWAPIVALRQGQLFDQAAGRNAPSEVTSSGT